MTPQSNTDQQTQNALSCFLPPLGDIGVQVLHEFPVPACRELLFPHVWRIVLPTRLSTTCARKKCKSAIAECGLVPPRQHMILKLGTDVLIVL